MINDTYPNLPNFLIVGAARCGTTTLYKRVMDHPQVYFPSIKEPKFLAGSKNAVDFTGPNDKKIRERIISSEQEYFSLFSDTHGARVVGEASVDTLYYYKTAISNIKRYIGDPRIVIILRNPVDRAYSAFRLLTRDGRERLSFKEALEVEDERIQAGYEFMWHYVNAGMYAEAVKQFKEQFSHVLVLTFDELIGNPADLFERLFRFLNITPIRPRRPHRRFACSGPLWMPAMHQSEGSMASHPQSLKNSTVPKAVRSIVYRTMRRAITYTRIFDPVVSPEIAVHLQQWFAPDITKLQTVTGLELSPWLEQRDAGSRRMR
jgi:hypothetical protein